MVWNIFKGTSADRPAMAAVLMLAALMLLSFQDGLVKLASGATSLWQFQFLRATSNIALITLGLAYAGRLALLWPQNPKAVLIRSLVMVATMVFFFAGAPFISLAEMAAGLYTHPVFTSLLGWWVLRERFGKWRMAALVLSFIGAALLIRPWDIGFHPAQLLPICGGFTYAVNNLILRRYCRNESPVTMAAWSAAGFFAIALFGIVVLTLWQPQETATWPFLLQAWPALMGFVVAFAIVASVCNVAGNILIVKAYQSAEISWLAPIDYCYLIFASFWGLVLFSDVPDGLTLTGMALIAAGGILTAWRESRLKLRATKAVDLANSAP